LLGETTSEVWRDPTGAVALLHVAPDEAWVGRSVREFEAATGGRVAIVTRFGSGQVPGEDTIVQSGDALHLLAAVSAVPAVKEAASRPPEVVSS
jgi:trk system potassium uptake protein TrkA